MRQTMTEAEIIHHFRSAGSRLEVETQILDAVIRDIVIHGQKVTSKAIILYLIGEIECASDTAQLNALRNVLEIVVGRTPDDDGF